MAVTVCKEDHPILQHSDTLLPDLTLLYLFLLLPCVNRHVTLTHHVPASPAGALQWLQMAYLIYRRRYIFPILIPLCHGPAVAAIMFGHYQRHRKVMALMNHCRLTPMVQQRWVRAIASWRLVPGDVVVLQPGRATCDMVLLQGACLVTESMLTGEVRFYKHAPSLSTCSCISLTMFIKRCSCQAACVKICIHEIVQS